MKAFFTAVFLLPVVAFAQNYTVAVIPKGVTNFWKNYEAGVSMSMPQIVRQYIHSFRQEERVKVLQLAAAMRRDGPMLRSDGLARIVGEKIQKWQDEDDPANFPA